MMYKEKDLIKKFFLPLSKNPESQNLSNDAAVIKKSSDLVITSDMMIEDIHFDSLIHPRILAKKILRVNLSDLAAMGASTYGYNLNIGIPKNLEINWLKNFCTGLKQDQQKYNLKLFGGDLSSSEKIFLSVTMLGKVKNKFLKTLCKKRSDIFVTGNIGDAALGFTLQRKNKKFRNKNKIIEKLKKRHELPNPRLDVGCSLLGFANSCKDLSDGLLNDLNEICQLSNLKAKILLEKIPLSNEAKEVKKIYKNEKKFWDLILTFGEDYELIFTMSESKQKVFFKHSHKIKTKITKIGSIYSGHGIEVLDHKNDIIKFNKLGFSHF